MCPVPSCEPNFPEMKPLGQMPGYLNASVCQILFLKGYTNSSSHISYSHFQCIRVLAYIFIISF